MPYSAVGDNRNFMLMCSFNAVNYRGYLRHSHAGNNSCGADCAGPDADLDCVGAGCYQILGSLGGRDIARNHVDIIIGFYFLYGVDNVLRMAVCGIDYDNIRIGCYKSLDSFIVLNTYCGTNTQSASMVPGGYWILLDAVNISHSNQASQLVFAVNQQQLLDLVLL